MKSLKKFSLGLIGLLSLIFCLGSSVSAHNPRLVYQTATNSNNPYQITQPEISQAFYGDLKWDSDYYQIKSETWFNLYVNIVVPIISGARTDFQVVILNAQGSVLKILDGINAQRKDFYEPFAGDAYYQGPEWDQDVGPGTYTLIVSNPYNQGKYSLAVWKIERFTIKDIVHTLAVLGNLKTQFFGKPIWTMFYNLTGVFLLAVIVALIAVILFVRFVINKIIRKSSKNKKIISKSTKPKKQKRPRK